MPLFTAADWVLAERRLAWLYRISLLRDAGRVTEALAWACLETELHPDNAAAAALKERLKTESGLLVRSSPPGSQPAAPRSHLPSNVWKGVAGMRDLKAMLERDVILPIQEPAVYARYRLSLPNGILLYGPPGCGKTYIARKLAGTVGFNFIEVKPGDLASIYVHGTQGKIAELFTSARQQAPCVLFLDEIDAMVPSRGADSVGHHYASEVNEFLVQLNECAKQRVLVVGATNLPKRLDPAVVRPGRLDKKFFVGPPDYEARVELLKIHLANRPQARIDWHRCATELQRYTCAEVELVVNEAARRALGADRNISTEDLVWAASVNPCSHSDETISCMRNPWQ
jgi:transitional endoplasmic reticulum ATPase